MYLLTQSNARCHRFILGKIKSLSSGNSDAHLAIGVREFHPSQPSLLTQFYDIFNPPGHICATNEVCNVSLPRSFTPQSDTDSFAKTSLEPTVRKYPTGTKAWGKHVARRQCGWMSLAVLAPHFYYWKWMINKSAIWPNCCYSLLEQKLFGAYFVRSV